MKDETRHVQLNEAKWDKWAPAMDRQGGRYDSLREAQGQVVSLLDLHEGVHFLDVGCGTGWAVGQVAERVNGRGLFYGVDLSLKMIERATHNFGGQANFRFLRANSESIPLDGDFFDIIICTNSFHHYLNPDKALGEMHRLLKEGGRLFILDPLADAWIVKLADQFMRRLEPAHVKIYSTKEFQRLFEKAGLKYSASRLINWHQAIHIGEK